MTNVGEIATAVTSIAAGALLTFRPAAGEQYVLLSVGSDGIEPANSYIAIGYGLTDGTNVSYLWTSIPGVGGIPFQFHSCGFDNTNYLFVYNRSANPQYLSFSAIRVK